jgi:hypothetical protein
MSGETPYIVPEFEITKKKDLFSGVKGLSGDPNQNHMRKSLLLTLSALGLASGLFAQTLMTNDGATLIVEAGATLTIQGGLENINGGIINNDGTIDVQGNFTNSATFDGADVNTVIFSGNTNANVTSGGAVFHHVTMNKTAADINLQDDMTLKGTLTFQADNNQINVGANDLVLQNAGSVTSYDNNEFVVTGDVGYMRKQGLDASETQVFPVGNTSTTYNPATVAANGGHTGDVISVRVTDNLYLDGLAETDPATEAAANAMWDITEGTGGGSDVNLTLQWAVSDQLPNFPTEVGISRHDGSNWDMLETQVSAPVGADPRTQVRNNVTSFGAFAVGGEPVGHALAMSMKIFLQGAYSGGTMTDILRDSMLIPEDEPYAGTPYNYAHEGFGGDESVNASVFTPTGNNAIVDWVHIQLRDQSNPATVLATKSALVQRDGDIVDLDGVSPLSIYGLADGSYHIAVRHRNHLGIRTASAQALTNTPLVYNFTTGLGQVFDDGTVTTNEAMADLGGGVFGLWAGNASNNDNTRYNGSGSDRNAILQEVGITAPNNVLLNQYHICDVNMNTNVRYNGSNNDRNAILAIVGITSPNNVITEHLD